MKNKCVVVTGATRGIGWAISQRLADQGCHVVGLARTSSEIDFPGYLYACDLSNAGETEDILRVIREKYPVDAVVNNVGVVAPGLLGEIDLADLYRAYDLNVRVAVQVTQAFLPAMKARQEGRIVNITSRAAFGARDRSSYAAAKSALEALTHTWAIELAPFGITVNTVAPGPVETELFRAGHPVGSDAEKRALASIPLGRLASPADVAGAVSFFLSDDGSYITGQILGVDGGGTLVNR